MSVTPEVYMDGLGRFKFKRLKKLLMHSPLAPMPVKIMALKHKKKRVAVAAPVAPYPPNPTTPVAPVYVDEPFHQPVVQQPAYQQPVYSPINAGYVQQPEYRQPAPALPTEMSWPTSGPPSARDLPVDIYASNSPIQDDSSNVWMPPEPPGDNAPDDLPIISAPENEAESDAEYGWLQGLSEGAKWGDIFTSAASEIIAAQKAKRREKQVAAQRAAMTSFDPSGGGAYSGYSTGNWVIPVALGVGGLLLFMRMNKRRGR